MNKNLIPGETLAVRVDICDKILASVVHAQKIVDEYKGKVLG